ncbi:hypothetical protein D3C71_800120 [compost metagenome]
MDGFHHQRDDGLDQALGLFRIEVMDQRRGAGHVGKQRRDDLAFAGGLAPGLHGCLFGANAFGKVVGRIMNGAGEGPETGRGRGDGAAGASVNGAPHSLQNLSERPAS